MKYRYFVSFATFVPGGNSGGLACSEFILDNKISDMEDINTLKSMAEQKIEDNEQTKYNVVVLNYQLLGEVKEEKKKRVAKPDKQ